MRRLLATRSLWVWMLLGLCLGKECQRNEACGMVEYRYAPPTTTTTTTPAPTTTEEPGSGEGSGWGSGEGPTIITLSTSEPLIYDELVVEVLEEELWAVGPESGEEAESSSFTSLCDCGGGGGGGGGGVEEECPVNGTVVIDEWLRVSLCSSEMPWCGARQRGAVVGRVMGELEGNPDPASTRTMLSYNRTQLYCRCPPPLFLSRLHNIEFWPTQNLVAFPLTCL